jgi:hypothetical protein
MIRTTLSSRRTALRTPASKVFILMQLALLACCAPLASSEAFYTGEDEGITILDSSNFDKEVRHLLVCPQPH